MRKDENVGGDSLKQMKESCTAWSLPLSSNVFSLWESGQSGGLFWARRGFLAKESGAPLLRWTPFLTRRLITLQSPDHTHNHIVVQESFQTDWVVSWTTGVFLLKTNTTEGFVLPSTRLKSIFEVEEKLVSACGGQGNMPAIMFYLLLTWGGMWNNVSTWLTSRKGLHRRGKGIHCVMLNW